MFSSTVIPWMLPGYFPVTHAWPFWTFHTTSHNMKALVILIHSWSPFLPIVLYGKNELMDTFIQYLTLCTKAICSIYLQNVTTPHADFFYLTVIKPWLNLPTGRHGHVIYIGNLGGVFFSHENTPEGSTETHKSSFFPYKQVSGRNCDHEWLRITKAFILYDLLWTVQKSNAVNREGNIKG